MEKYKFPLENLQRFEWWLQVNGYETRPPRGMWQVLQVKYQGNDWACLFSRKKGITQLTVDPRLVPLILRFELDLTGGLVPVDATGVPPEPEEPDFEPIENGPNFDTGVYDPKHGHPGFKRTA